MGAAYTQTGVLAKGRAEGSAGEIEKLGRELGLAGACPPPKAGARRGAGTGTQVSEPETHGGRRACPEGAIWAAQVEASPACGDHQGRPGRSAARG